MRTEPQRIRHRYPRRSGAGQPRSPRARCAKPAPLCTAPLLHQQWIRLWAAKRLETEPQKLRPGRHFTHTAAPSSSAWGSQTAFCIRMSGRDEKWIVNNQEQTHCSQEPLRDARLYLNVLGLGFSDKCLQGESPKAAGVAGLQAPSSVLPAACCPPSPGKWAQHPLLRCHAWGRAPGAASTSQGSTAPL